MESSFVIKPRAGAYVPRDPVRVREAIGTELDMDKAVAAAGDDNGKPGGQRHDQTGPRSHAAGAPGA